MPVQAKRVPSHHKKHHKITRVDLGEAPRHHAVHRDLHFATHFVAPLPPAPRSPNPTPHAITSLPLPPDEAPMPVATAPAPATVAAAPASTPLPKIHPIILPAPPTTPEVLVASGIVSAGPIAVDTDAPAPFARVRFTVSRPTPAVKPDPTVVAIVAPAPAPPAPKPYVLPGHALSLNEELTLINNLNQSPRRRRSPRFFGWIGREVARPFKFLLGEPEI